MECESGWIEAEAILDDVVVVVGVQAAAQGNVSVRHRGCSAVDEVLLEVGNYCSLDRRIRPAGRNVHHSESPSIPLSSDDCNSA